VPVDIRPFTPDDAEAVHVLAMRAFSSRVGTPMDPERPRIADDRRLVAEVDGRVVGHLGAWDLGQWFGGRRIPVAGISAVTVAPEVRGQRVGTQLLRAGLEQALDRGEPIASLFPLTRAIYRSAGFELAGAHPRATVTTAALAGLAPPDADDLEVVPGGTDDVPAMAALERAIAATETGALDRTDTFARRNLEPGEHGRIVLVRRGGELTGYLVYTHEDPGTEETGFFRLEVRELVARDPQTLRALYRVLGSHASGAREAEIPWEPEDALELWLPEHAVTASRVAWRWMVRLLDAPAAVAARGWPEAVRLRCELHLDDPTWPDRGGAWTLEVADGRGSLERGGAGTVRLDVGAFGSWFTGYQSATRLARYGRLTGADETTRRDLDAATAGPTPWVRAFF
jgi:predicted acetyltransferase